VNPAAVAVMAEVGIDIARNVPRRWNESDIEEADVVLTMGCGDTCPFVPGTRYEDWPIDDPAGLTVEAVRPIRDAIRARVEELLGELVIRTES
jgi:arsenate reductase